ncbi:helix-turn-helix domain-containing protein [Actinomadura decatromicini]|uniref:helix-turn-helix domain-containing protein n=1 Tax=Actinomadura decatromicini TaxID=2604572 RepID=UPI001FE34FB2|nr:helix-turn-helix transcriptional regulator [Actinomadura decatromicini]
MSPSLLSFGRRFRRFREAKSWSQDNLARRARDGEGVTPQYIGQVETGRTRCSREFAEAMDTVLETNGELVALWEDLVKDAAFPVWFDWVGLEEAADALESWQAMLVHGLLQTPAYVTAVLHGRSEAIEARLKRQEILVRDEPPDCTFLMDEGVLYREVGGPEVMREQLEHLLSPPSERITVQVVPTHGEHIGNMGSFTCATLEDLTEVAYVETIARGFTMGDVEDITEVRRALREIRSLALPVSQSADLIRRTVKERWT